MAAAEHRRWQENLAAYALGALEPPEAAELERHLAGCKRCRAEMRWLRPALEVLPESVEQHEPPSGLRERLMGTVRAEARRPEATAGPAAESRPRRRLSGLQRFVLRPVAAAVAIAVLIAGALGYAIHGGRGGAGSTVAALPTAAGPQVSADLIRKGNSTMLMVSSLPPLGRGHVYQAWIKRGSTFEPSTVFVLRADGTAAAAIPEALRGADAVLVTREPAGGSRRPSTAPLLRAPLN